MGAEPGTDSALWRGHLSQGLGKSRSWLEEGVLVSQEWGQHMHRPRGSSREHRAFRNQGWAVSQSSKGPNPLIFPPWAWMPLRKEGLEQPGVT